MKNQKNSTALRLSGSTASKGFTLVELLVVIGIIAILFAVVLVAINPAKRFAESSNARRLADVNSILGGITTSTVDLKGTLPTGLTYGAGTAITPNAIKPRFIGSGTSDISTTASTTFQANACYFVGTGTCAVTGFSCTTNADCPISAAANVCNIASSRCAVSGRYCTTNADCNATNQYCVAATYCAQGGNPCTVNNAADTTNCVDMASNTCIADKIGYKRPYDLGNSSEGIVPTYIGAMPKDPSGAGFTGTAPVMSDLQTGYAVFNVPSTVTSSYALGNNGAAAAGSSNVTIAVAALLPNPKTGDIITIAGDTNPNATHVVTATPTWAAGTMTIVTDRAYTAVVAAGAITVISSPATASATNRIKVVSCNPNDADSDGSYVNNKIEVLR